MTPDEKKKRIAEALKEVGSRIEFEQMIAGDPPNDLVVIYNAARDLLRLLEEMPGEKQITGLVYHDGYVEGHNALRQRVIGILMGDKG